MTEETIYDFTVELLDNGGAELSQRHGCSNGCEGTVTVTLHPCHLRHLFERLGYLKPVRHDAFARRLARELNDTLDELYACRIDEDRQLQLRNRLDWFVDEIVEPTGLLDEEPSAEIETAETEIAK